MARHVMCVSGMGRVCDLKAPNVLNKTFSSFGPATRVTQNFRSNRSRIQGSRRDVLGSILVPCCCGLCKPKDGWYDKFFAGVMASGMDAYEEAVMPMKLKLLSGARKEGGGPQSVLEIGIGAGPNLQYLTCSTLIPAEGLTVTGVDPNPFMFDYARESAEAAGLPSDALELKLGVAEDIPVESGSFDTVICTLVLCSVPDVKASVKEIRRVLKPGGKVYFLEHTFAEPSRPLLRLGQRFFNPLQQLLADGCHLDRNPLPIFEAAGFSSIAADSFDVPGMGFIAPHISGIATV